MTDSNVPATSKAAPTASDDFGIEFGAMCFFLAIFILFGLASGLRFPPLTFRSPTTLSSSEYYEATIWCD